MGRGWAGACTLTAVTVGGLRAMMEGGLMVVWADCFHIDGRQRPFPAGHNHLLFIEGFAGSILRYARRRGSGYVLCGLSRLGGVKRAGDIAGPKLSHGSAPNIAYYLRIGPKYRECMFIIIGFVEQWRNKLCKKCRNIPHKKLACSLTNNIEKNKNGLMNNLAYQLFFIRTKTVATH